MDADPADAWLISLICGTLVDLSTWFDQARNMTAEQQCIRGCFSDVRGGFERELSVPTSLIQEHLVPLLGQQRTTDDC